MVLLHVLLYCIYVVLAGMLVNELTVEGYQSEDFDIHVLFIYVHHTI